MLEGMVEEETHNRLGVLHLGAAFGLQVDLLEHVLAQLVDRAVDACG